MKKQRMVHEAMTQQAIQGAPWQQPPPSAGGPPLPPGGPTLPQGPQPPPVAEELRRLQQQASEQIKQSEQNLAAHNTNLMQQQQMQIDEAIQKGQEQKFFKLCEDAGLNLEEMDKTVQPIIESCTKDAISTGKTWILTHNKTEMFCNAVAIYMKRRVMAKGSGFETQLHLIYLMNDVLHHCQRKNVGGLKTSLEQVVVPIFCTAQLTAAGDEEKKTKLNKLLNLWVTNKYFEPDIMMAMKDPALAISNYQAGLIIEHAAEVTQITADVKQRYASLEKQHHEYVAHVNNQLQQQQQQLQRPSFSGPGPHLAGPMGGRPPMGPGGGPPFSGPPPNYNQPPPMFSQPPPNFPRGPMPGPRPPFDYLGPGGEPRGPRGPAPPEFSQANAPFPLPDFSRPPPGFAGPGGPGPGGPTGGIPPHCEADLMPSMPYYELPAGLMAPLVKLEDTDYKPLDPKDIRLPPPMPPSERLLAAVEAFYCPPSHERPRDAEGWEKLGLYEFFKAKQRAKKVCEEIKEKKVSPVRKRRYSDTKKSRSPSPPPRSRSRSRSKSRSRSSSYSPPRRGRRRRSRSRSRSRSKSRSKSRSRSRSISPITPYIGARRDRSGALLPMPSGTSMDTKLGQDNKGHMLMKAMGWSGGGLGQSEQGIVDPIHHAEVRDKVDMYRGIGNNMNDPFEQFRKNKSQGFVQRMKARDDVVIKK